MRSLPPIANWVRVSLVLMFASVYCSLLIGTLALITLTPEPRTELLISIGLIAGSVLIPFLRDLVGLPQRRNFEKLLEAISKYFRTKLT